MNLRVSGALATATILAFTNAAAAQSAGYFQYTPNGFQQGVIAPAATSTYQTTPSAPTISYGAPQTTYTQPATSGYVQQPFGTTTYATTPASQQPTVIGSATTPSYASPYTPTGQTTYTQSVAPTYVPPAYGTANTTYQTLQAPAYQAQQMPVYQQPGFGTVISQQPLSPPAGYTPLVPATTAPANDSGLQDTDTWSFNFARFYPAVQACLRKSAAKNPVIANIQVSDNKTMMLIGEGGSANYSICATGLGGTTVKANSEIRSMPPAFYAPVGSTFTVSPDRPFQPIVDTDQKIIGWLVRTQPTNAMNQFGQASNFDGQFIPPMMVNTSAGKS